MIDKGKRGRKAKNTIKRQKWKKSNGTTLSVLQKVLKMLFEGIVTEIRLNLLNPATWDLAITGLQKMMEDTDYP